MKTFILTAMLCFATFGAFGQSNGNSETTVPVGLTVHKQESNSSFISAS